MATTKIEWTDASWNPITGCTKVSVGCANCYAERMAKRLRGRAGYPVDDPFAVTVHCDRLEEPLHWRKSRRVFVCSMSDLFHEGVPKEAIRRVFGIMHTAKRHTYQVLTKRPRRMRGFLSWYADWVGFNAWPREYKHVWLGVSVENQATADERIPQLLDTPAVVRFLSCEPLLAPIDLDRWLDCASKVGPCSRHRPDWVIVGGESGLGARPCHPDWVRSIRDQCVAAGVPFFFKQWGGRNKKATGRILDGRTWDEIPEMKRES